MRLHTQLVSLAVLGIFLSACSTPKKLKRSAQDLLLNQEGLQHAHIGISVYDPQKGSYLYNYQANKYFVPASNTKLFSLYAALKYLDDSIPGIRYAETADSIYLEATGDPTLLHPDYPVHPVIDWLKSNRKELVIHQDNWKEKELGYGWSWDDFNSSYMPEKSPLPVYGNTIRWTQVLEKTESEDGAIVNEAFVYSEPEVSWKVNFNPSKTASFSVIRDRYTNQFTISEGKEILRTIEIPFVTNGVFSALDLLRDTIGRSILLVPVENTRKADKIIYSQLRDSVLKTMMYRSDNFFAEQVLLMAAQKEFGWMNTYKIIDTLLKSSLKGLPDPPKWVDGSGLSRYNLFTPQDFIWLLEKMEKEMGRERVFSILPGSDQGTLSNYYTGMAGAIHAKTGTLSGHVAISGYLTTKKGTNLLFSVLVNNHQTSAVKVRRSVEAFLQKLWEMN
ncbi:D-alanyl-D-alanine carboxypeptidase/D-alanyl-D-alanine-endopeptidase [Flavihumibacter sp. UBA7668]|uniref:D-alanyl-D-alanine carboxypeptidase/D-alanyl-D-alanine-endopeptidase n=1 Tax=Flavihumibacter sp. UBA7668 TaxID=1946542 RepID=UPI0025BFAACD|nr:D-alanyl-D-alanine carboxypeptidase [Flavihumibacter sp. UBA7668]